MNKPDLTIPISKIQSQALLKFKNNSIFEWSSLKRVPYIKKIRNEREIKKLTKELFFHFESINLQAPDNTSVNFKSPEMTEAKIIITQYLKEIDSRNLLFDQSFLDFFIDNGYLDVAEEFIGEAKKTDSDLPNEDIFQALRNVWIMNSLQLYWNLPLQMTPSVYSYSMLYPYTDNDLDDPHINPLDKIQFNHRIENALNGIHISSDIPKEQRITDLIKNIEVDYNRKEYPQIFESIHLIHDAQVNSLQQAHKKILSENSLLDISFYKGGTSVLADAYLVKPDLSFNDALFSYEYGAFLQLIDDLQDIIEDTETNHKTYFNFPSDIEETNHKIENLLAYIYEVNKMNDEDSTNQKFMKEVIRDCTLIMVMETIGSNPSIVSPSFYYKLEAHSKVRLSFYKEFKDYTSNFLNNGVKM